MIFSLEIFIEHIIGTGRQHLLIVSWHIPSTGDAYHFVEQTHVFNSQWQLMLYNLICKSSKICCLHHVPEAKS